MTHENDVDFSWQVELKWYYVVKEIMEKINDVENGWVSDVMSFFDIISMIFLPFFWNSLESLFCEEFWFDYSDFEGVYEIFSGLNYFICKLCNFNRMQF